MYTIMYMYTTQKRARTRRVTKSRSRTSSASPVVRRLRRDAFMLNDHFIMMS